MLTEEHRKNLDLLATKLESLPPDYDHFGMNVFTSLHDDDELRYARENGGLEQFRCGAVACAVGHGPSAGVLVPSRLIYPIVDTLRIDWNGYCELFGAEPNGPNFRWMFDSTWSDCDDSHYGAAARIRYLLEYGSPPYAFDYAEPEWLPLYAEYRKDYAESI